MVGLVTPSSFASCPWLQPRRSRAALSSSPVIVDAKLSLDSFFVKVLDRGDSFAYNEDMKTIERELQTSMTASLGLLGREVTIGRRSGTIIAVDLTGAQHRPRCTVKLLRGTVTLFSNELGL
jgi:hypothetical protein